MLSNGTAARAMGEPAWDSGVDERVRFGIRAKLLLGFAAVQADWKAYRDAAQAVQRAAAAGDAAAGAKLYLEQAAPAQDKMDVDFDQLIEAAGSSAKADDEANDATALAAQRLTAALLLI